MKKETKMARKKTKTQTPSEPVVTKTDNFPSVTQLTQSQAHRMITGDWLRAVAGMIERGAVSAFDIAWSEQLEKPKGRVVTTSDFLIAPVEARFHEEIEKIKAEQNSILLDMTEELKSHDANDGEDHSECQLCSTKLS
jgi:hypothetical protein